MVRVLHCHVCDIRVLRLLKLTCIENNYMTNYSGDMAYHNHKPNNLSLEEVPQFSGDRQVGCEKGILAEN